MLRGKKSVLLVFAVLFLGSFSMAADVPEKNNGENPSGKTVKLKLTEDLRLGPEMGDDFIWASMGVTADADSKGNIYVTSPQEFKVSVYDPSGKFLKSFGGQGEGPGEFQVLATYQILSDDTGAAFGAFGMNGAFHFFDKEQTFVKKDNVNSMALIWTNAALSPTGSHIAGMGIQPKGTHMHWKHMLQNRENKEEMVLVSYDTMQPGPQIMQSSDAFAEYMGAILKPIAQGNMGFFAYDDNGNMYSGVAKKYHVTVWDKEMKKVRTFGRKYKRLAITEQEIKDITGPTIEGIQSSMPPQMKHLFTKATFDKAIELAEFPPYKQPMGGIIPLKDGYVAVVHDASPLEKEITMDLFNGKGAYVGQTKLKTNAFVNGQFLAKSRFGYIYTVETNEDDESELVRYKYTLN